jgi:hypothetical protein
MAHLLFPEEVLQQLPEEPLPDEPWEFEDEEEEDEVTHTSEKQSEDT